MTASGQVREETPEEWGRNHLFGILPPALFAVIFLCCITALFLVARPMLLELHGPGTALQVVEDAALVGLVVTALMIAIVLNCGIHILIYEPVLKHHLEGVELARKKAIDDTEREIDWVRELLDERRGECK